MTAAQAIARAWHPVACRWRALPYERCQYASQHEHTARLAIIELGKAGYRVVQEPIEAMTVPMFGDAK